MEANTSKGSTTGAEVPSLLANVEVSHLDGFDTTTPAPSPHPPLSPRTQQQLNQDDATRPTARVRPLDRVTHRSDAAIPQFDSPFQPPGSRHAPHVSISLPTSPTGFSEHHLPPHAGGDGAEPHRLSRTSAADEAERPPMHHAGRTSKVMFRSQPIPGGVPAHMGGRMNSRAGRTMNRGRYDSFKTFSGKLERQITHLAGGGVPVNTPEEEEVGDAISGERTPSLPPNVDRFFAALEGPELDKLKSSEALVLPSDKKWPFLLRFPVSTFGMCLGVSSQAILYKTIATAPPTEFLHVSLKVNLVLWFIAVTLMSIITTVYACKIVFFFEAVRREYYHPVRVNFFFAPWIACMFLAMGVPPSVVAELPGWLWYALMAPMLCLELKIYGQWMSGGDRRLSKVANPSNHLSIVGNFVGALLGASMGLKEGPLFFFGVGMAHYAVLFVTLYQRLPTNATLPKDLHPVFFLFVAAPSVASMAWAKITDEFGLGAKLAYFIAMFLYASLAVRINFFRGINFSLSWWAYTFPMTGAGIASIRYATVVDNTFTRGLSLGLSLLATLTVTGLFATTMVHAFIFRNLFPNDIAIAITHKKIRPIMELEQRSNDDDSRSGSSTTTKDIEAGPTAAVAPES
ncbi:S-type anion channel SLAH2-like [Lolium rigidum]|uniref:S-type anion channel SLAH2-like n=1 Tax=Lolium rigidum TaxID=89674 RepID=UPI001F5D7C5D|nr:S-type anion channel SLAH2-like [Lolium rigidum]